MVAEQIRTFIAIELDDPQKRALSDLQSRLKRERGSNAIRWTAPENIHLTLKFLGNVDADMMLDLQGAVADACTGASPFVLKLGGVGAFPNINRANVVWIGVQGDIEAATKLAQNIDEACAALGFPHEERPFSPHLTLGRVNRDASPRDRQGISEMITNAAARELEPLQRSKGHVLRVERVSVMKSELSSGGSKYTRLSGITLRSEDATNVSTRAGR